jgi:hypothetical protein
MTKTQVFKVLDSVVRKAWKKRKLIDDEAIPPDETFELVEHFFEEAKQEIEALEVRK